MERRGLGWKKGKEDGREGGNEGGWEGRREAEAGRAGRKPR